METTMNDFKKELNNINSKASAVAKSAANKARSATEELIDSSNPHQLTERLQDYRDRGVELYDASMDRVRENPMTSLAIAMGLGFIAGLFMRRR